MAIQILRERLRLVSCVGIMLVAAIGSGFVHQAAAFSGRNEVADNGAVVLDCSRQKDARVVRPRTLC
jgi:hypothetical protein